MQDAGKMDPRPPRDQDGADNPSNERSSHCERGRNGDSGRGRGRGRDRGKSRGRGGYGGPRGHDREGRGRRNKEAGRAEWSRKQVDKRARNTEAQQAAKRRKLEGEEERLPVYATKFSKEEIEAQEKKPKRKVAVMIGYSGSGYKGMQLNHHEKTIEGDLFTAFVAAGAISKANADDPRKSSLVRCARTDKGVHAAGNLISLKLIVEDPDIVAKINEQLNPQIRVWGIERTNGSFSAYQLCDSRIYEYLVPTHCFLSPHPKSFLARNIVELAEKVDDLDGYLDRQEEVAQFWPETEEKYVKPVIDDIDPSIRDAALRVFYEYDDSASSRPDAVAANQLQQEIPKDHDEYPNGSGTIAAAPMPDADGEHVHTVEESTSSNPTDQSQAQALPTCPPKEPTSIDLALRRLKAAHIAAKRAYRIHPTRLARVRSCLSHFEGSHKYHNYTIDKTHKDPSATRIIKSFKVGEKPIVIGDTEWLSLKVHGQSFMMHQIRKMVSMVALMIRCGCHEGRLQDSYDAHRISIPKAPSLGLLLERPVFDEYNRKLEEFGRAKIDFSRHEKEMEAFKQREIYERIFREEERDNCFHSFFVGLDNTRSSQLFYLSSIGVEAVERSVNPMPAEGRYGEKRDIGLVEEEDEGGEIGEG